MIKFGNRAEVLPLIINDKPCAHSHIYMFVCVFSHPAELSIVPTSL